MAILRNALTLTWGVALMSGLVQLGCTSSDRNFGVNDPDHPGAAGAAGEANGGSGGGSGGGSAGNGSGGGGGSSSSSGGNGGGAATGSGGSGANGGSAGAAGDGMGGSAGATGDSVTAIIDASPDLVGFTTELDGSASSSSTADDLSYTWEVVSVPNGSSITTESLSASDGVSVSFTPDLGGDYEIELTVTSGELSNTTTKTVTVPTVDIGYLTVAGDEATYTRAGAMVQSDGQNVRQVGCFFSNAASSESSWLSSFRSEGQFSMKTRYPGELSEDAILAYSYVDDDTGDSYFQIAGPDTGCDTNPPVTTPGGLRPVFSPDGTRVAYGVDGSAGFEIRTVGVDGSNPRAIRSDSVSSFLTSAIAWIDNSHLVWADLEENADQSDTWTVIYSSEDSADAFNNNLLTDVLMDCENATNGFSSVTQVALADDVLYLGDVTGLGATYRTWRLTPVSGQYVCDTMDEANSLLVEPDAHDFELSPDGTQMVYYSQSTPAEGEYDTTEIFIGPSDGSDFEVLVPHNGGANTGAHWVANGRQITWTNTVFDADSRPVESSIWIVNADGTRPRRLHQVMSTASEARMLHTGGNGCGFAAHRPGRPVPVLVLFAVVGLGVARRRRSQVSARS